MIASSAFVLMALTMTGVYVKNNNSEQKNDGYQINFDQLENQVKDELGNTGNQMQEQLQNLSDPIAKEDDLDYTPMEEVGSGDVEIPGLTGDTANSGGKTAHAGEEELAPDLVDEAEETGMTSEVEKENDLADAGEEVTSGSQVKKQEISWQAGDYFVWPVNGNVLIPYSMDKTVYFATLDQYKYSRAMVLAAEEGTTIYASASGTVESVYTDAEIGNAVKLNIGGGYEVVYGQLKDIQVKEGGYVEKAASSVQWRRLRNITVRKAPTFTVNFCMTVQRLTLWGHCNNALYYRWKILTMAGRVYENGTIGIQNGKIAEIKEGSIHNAGCNRQKILSM